MNKKSGRPVNEEKLRRCDPNWLDVLVYRMHIKQGFGKKWTLGKRIFHSGGSALLYRLNDTSRRDTEPKVVKIIDLQMMIPEYRQKICKNTQYEIEIMRKLDGQYNTVKLIDSFVVKKKDGNLLYVDGSYKQDDPVIFYLVMPEYSLIPKNRILEQKKVIKLGIDICNALQILADRGKIHRDVKPDNIFVYIENYILGDFGIARDLTPDKLTNIATIQYYPPEWYSGFTDKKNGDLYSLAVTMAELLGGKLEFPNGNTEIVGWLNWQDFKNRHLACPALQEILRKGLVNYNERYQEPKLMQEDLIALMQYIELCGELPAALTLSEVKSAVANLRSARTLATASTDSKTLEGGPDSLMLSDDERIEQVKNAIRAQKFEQAVAMIPCSNQNPRLRALLAYSKLHLLHKGTLLSEDRKDIEKILEECVGELEIAAIDESVREQRQQLLRRVGNVKCILAVSRYEGGKCRDFLNLLRDAADLGSPMASYILGRGLYTGDAPFVCEKTVGLQYLKYAVSEGYHAAIDFRNGHNNSKHAIDDILSEF